MNINVISRIDIDPVLRILGGNDLGKYAAERANFYMQPLIPRNTGQLSEFNVRISPWEIEYYAPYAAIVYNMSKNNNFRKDPHYKAGPEWDKRFVQEKTDYEKLVKDIQNWLNSKI